MTTQANINVLELVNDQEGTNRAGVFENPAPKIAVMADTVPFVAGTAVLRGVIDAKASNAVGRVTAVWE